MDSMRADGEKMFNDNRNEIINMIEAIVDKKFGHRIKDLEPRE